MKEKLKYYGAVASTVGVLIWAIYAWAGQITLTTYYPAPTGNYVNLTVTGNTYLATSSGNVGIGVTGPNAHLTLNKLGGSESQFADGLKIYRYSYGSVTEDYAMLNKYQGIVSLTSARSGGYDPIYFQGYNGTSVVTRMVIDTNSGNVGIGVTNPGAALTVTKNSNGWDNAVRLLDQNGANEWNLHSDTGGQFMIGRNGLNLITGLSSGNVGIGNTNPGFTLTVNGTAWVTSGTWSGSDLRWKEHIATLDEPLAKLLNLRGIKFDWKRKEFKANNFPEGRQIGMIAQEMEKEFPELVTTDKEGYKSIAYDRFTAVLLEGMKAQQKEIENLNQKVNALQDKLKNVHQ